MSQIGDGARTTTRPLDTEGLSWKLVFEILWQRWCILCYTSQTGPACQQQWIDRITTIRVLWSRHRIFFLVIPYYGCSLVMSAINTL